MLPEQQYYSEKTGAKFTQKHALSSPIQLKRNSFWGMAFSITQILVFAVSYPISIRFLGLETFGIYVMLMAVVTSLQLGAIKLPEAAIKFISETLVQNDLMGIRQYASSLIGAILAMGLIIALVSFGGQGLLAGIFPFSKVLSKDLPLLIILIALVTSMAMLAETIGGIVSGSGRMDLTFMLGILCRVTTFLVSLALLVRQHGLMALFYGSLAGYFLHICLGVFFMQRSLGFFPLGWRYFSWPHLKTMILFGLPLFSGSAVYCLVSPFNRLLLGYVIAPAAAGIFDIAEKGALAIRLFADSGLRPLVPQVSCLKALEDHRQISTLCLNTVRTIIIWATPPFILVFVAADHIIPLWVGTSSAPEMVSNLRILLLGSYATVLRFPFFYTFMGMGRVSYCFYADMITPVINVIIGVLGIWLVRQIWVISLASTLGMIISSLLVVSLFSGSWSAMLHMLLKGTKTVGLPIVAFAPLLLIKSSPLLLLCLSGTLCLLYVIYITFSRKLKAP
jgi:O-antigen/teichoic acid export membrane protein